MLYTRKGDTGTSGLFGTKVRLPKDSEVFEALGSVDELNSLLGVIRARTRGVSGEIDIAAEIKQVQECLFITQAELAGADKSLAQKHIDAVEGTIGRIEGLIEKPHGFVISGATELSAMLDYARAVARRTERAVVKAHSKRALSDKTRAYLNRLSSILYALARYAAAKEKVSESSPSY